MDIEPSKKGLSPQILTYRSLLCGIKKPYDSPFTINELKTELYRRIKNRLYQHCHRLCKKNRLNDSAAIELTQDVVLKGFDNISNFELDLAWDDIKCGNKLAAWFNIIAANHFIDLLKENARRCTVDFEDDDIEDEGLRPDDFEFEKDDTIGLRLQDAMDSLNDRERYIINVCLKHNCLGNKNHLPDKIIDEVCCSLGIKKGHVRVINHRALEKLRAMLKKK
jgi:RNA polymerase sigma factor (sigma-70 family)